MGFYGNITNTARTQFSFDRTYASRYEMDSNCATDGVYAGRYVLVEYDTDLAKDIYNSSLFCVNYKDSKTYKMYGQMNTTHGSNIFTGPLEATLATPYNEKTGNGVKNGQIVRIPAGHKIYDINSESVYIRFGATYPAFEFGTVAEYTVFWQAYPSLKSKFENIHFHIVNNSIVTDTPVNASIIEPGMVVEIPANYMYSLSAADEYWMATVNNSGAVSWKMTTPEDATHTVIMGTAPTSNYLQNFNNDISKYGTSRGYDSTVWQKVYANNTEKYVMIAELNTVVPTFDICADAPTLVPITPHFDANSNNVYYRFHWQPQWGFRTKAASNILKGKSIDAHGNVLPGSVINMTTDKVYYPSDQKTSWDGTFYDTKSDLVKTKHYNPAKMDWDTSTTKADFDAAIYYNAQGFDPSKVTYSADLKDKKRAGYNANVANGGWNFKDEILLAPTGLSGNTYNTHDGSINPQAQADTQELSIMLPSLGDSIAQIWDLVYGGRDTNNAISETSQRNTDIQWEDAGNVLGRDGLRLVNLSSNGTGYTFDKQQVNTLAGCINSLHDLMGMIIVDHAEDIKDLSKINPDYIYYNAKTKTYSRKHAAFNYKELKYRYQAIDVVESGYYQGFFYTNANGTTVADQAFSAYADSNKVAHLYVKTIADDNDNLWLPAALYGFVEGKSYFKTQNGDYQFATGSQPEFGKQYYTYGSSQPIKLTDSYIKNAYYYSNTDAKTNIITNYILSTADEVDKTQLYFEIDGDKRTAVNNPLTDKNIFDKKTGLNGTGENARPLVYLYLPDVFYYADTLSDVPGATKILRQEKHAWNELNWDSDGLLVSDHQYYMLDILDANPDDIQTITRWDETRQGYVEEQILSSIVSAAYPIQLRKFVDPVENKNSQAATPFYAMLGSVSVEVSTGLYKNIPGEYRLVTTQFLQDQYTLHFPSLSGTTQVRNATVFYQLAADAIVGQGKFYTENTYWYQPPGTKDWKLSRKSNFVKDDYVDIPVNDSDTEVIIAGQAYPINTANSTITYRDEVRKIDRTNHLINVPVARQYYIDLVMNRVANTPYLPDRYYELNSDGQYELDRKTSYDGKAHYKKNDVYVINDAWEFYNKGAKWNTLLSQIPASISLGTRTEVIELQPLTGFARAMNTAHGLILALNQLVEFNDTETRDPNTVQGMINTMQDVLHKFEQLNPRQVCIVDSYGQVHSTPWKTDNWINMDVNPDPRNPLLTVNHKFNKVNNTTSTTNKNTATTDADSLQLYTPIVDAMGHVVGKNTETVTLPFGFKILKAQNSSDDGNKWSQAGQSTSSSGENVTDILALNTKDSLSIKGGNKWIRLMTDTANRTLTIAHETHNISSSSTTDAANTFTTQAVTYDIAGHITGTASKKYTVPTMTIGEYQELTETDLSKLGLSSNTTIIEAFKKLSRRIALLEARVTALETPTE